MIKYLKIKPFWCFWLLTLLFISCKKETVPEEPKKEKTTVSAECGLFSYGDSIFYLREQPTDYIILPTSSQTGTYGAYPDGLEINSTTGAINVTKSETGLKYYVWFVPRGVADTCVTPVIISGINYLDKLYILEQNDTLAKPVYNASFSAQLPCSDGDDDDDDDGCEFDDGDDDDDGDGSGDEPPSGQEMIPQGVDISKGIANINLKQTLENGIFGANPVSGTFRNFKLNYRIQDASNKTLNDMNLRMYYFERRSQVPQALIDEINGKNQEVFVNARTTFYKPRPPYIVIIKYAN